MNMLNSSTEWSFCHNEWSLRKKDKQISKVEVKKKSSKKLFKFAEGNTGYIHILTNQISWLLLNFFQQKHNIFPDQDKKLDMIFPDFPLGKGFVQEHWGC